MRYILSQKYQWKYDLYDKSLTKYSNNNNREGKKCYCKKTFNIF